MPKQELIDTIVSDIDALQGLNSHEKTEEEDDHNASLDEIK